MSLRGPADANAFRTSHYGARWYHDPLPACPIAEATTDKWPAVSTLKRAWSKEFRKRWSDGNTYGLDPLRVALYVDESIDALSKMSTDERVPLMAGAAQRDLNRAAKRGTNVHAAIEMLVDGDEMQAQLLAGDYFDVCKRLIDDLALTFEYAEVVGLSRTLGMGGTIDSILSVGDKCYVVDWKTRGDTSDHGAYEGEAVQLGCYALADYLVADVDGAAQRVALPQLDGGLVVSIKTDSYEVYPVDLDKARDGARHLVETWKARRAGEKVGRAAIGKPILLVPPAAPVAERSEWITSRIAELAAHDEAKALVASKWPVANTKGPWTDREIDAIDAVLRQAERLVVVPFPEPDPTAVTEPKPETSAPPPVPLREVTGGDGAMVTELASLIDAVKTLTDQQRDHCSRWALEGASQGRSFAVHTDGTPERIVAVNTAAVACAKAFVTPEDHGSDELMRHALHLVIGEELQASWRTGGVLGSLTSDEAVLLASIANRFAAGDSDVTRRLGEMLAAA